MNTPDIRRIFHLIAEIERLSAQLEAHDNSPHEKARKLRVLEASKARLVAEQAAEAERVAQAEAGTLVDPLREDIIAELQREGLTRESAWNATSTPAKLIAQAQRFDFI